MEGLSYKKYVRSALLLVLGNNANCFRETEILQILKVR
jgi:hypothetical protein